MLSFVSIVIFAHARDLACEKQLELGVEIMGLPILSSNHHHAFFKDKNCGDYYSYGETLEINMDERVYGEWVIEIEGAFVMDNSICKGSRIINRNVVHIHNSSHYDNITVQAAFANECLDSTACTVSLSLPCNLYLDAGTIPNGTERIRSYDLFKESLELNHLKNPNEMREWLRVIHTITMALGWGILVPLAVSASIFKDKVGKNWIRIHKYLNIIATMVINTGFVCIFVTKQIHFHSLHGKIGMVLVVFIHFQIFNGCFRLSKTHRRRKYWEIMHKSIGYLQVVLSFYCIVSGVFYLI